MRRILSLSRRAPDPRFPRHALTAHFVDVGQGDATLFRFDDGKHMIVDTGPIDAGEARRLVSPFGRRRLARYRRPDASP